MAVGLCPPVLLLLCLLKEGADRRAFSFILLLQVQAWLIQCQQPVSSSVSCRAQLIALLYAQDGRVTTNLRSQDILGVLIYYYATLGWQRKVRRSLKKHLLFPRQQWLPNIISFTLNSLVSCLMVCCSLQNSTCRRKSQTAAQTLVQPASEGDYDNKLRASRF